MQDVTSNMAAALVMRSADSTGTINRFPCWLVEFYPNTYFPDADTTFDPTEAIALFSDVSVTWLGRTYRRQLESRPSLSRFISGQFNSVSLSFVNSDLYMSDFVLANNIESLRAVVRYIDLQASETIDDSVICFVGRLQKPNKLDEETCELSAVQELGSTNVEIPKRVFSATDPDGRSPGDPLFHGFKFTPVTGLFQYPTTVTKRHLLIFIHTSTEWKTGQWSSQDSINEGQALPGVLGRAQIELAAILWADIGTSVKGLWVAAGQKVSDIVSVASRTPGFYVTELTKHLGDPGGTGTNASPDPQFPTAGLLSDTAYIGANCPGSKLDPNLDPAPQLTGIVLCEVDLPDETDLFTLKGVSSNPAILARYVLTNPDYLNLDARLIHDGELLQTAQYCDQLLIDESNAEALILSSSTAESLVSAQIVRHYSTGTVTPTDFQNQIESNFVDPLVDIIRRPFIRIPIGTNPSDPPQVNGCAGIDTSLTIFFDQDLTSGSLPTTDFTVLCNGQTVTISSASASGNAVDLVLGTSLEVSDTVTVSYSGTSILSDLSVQADPFDSIPVTVGGWTPDGVNISPPMIVARKRYTYNSPILDKMPAVDLLFKTLLPSARMYMLTGGDGRIRLRTEKPADSSYLFTDALTGASTITLSDIEAWRASLQGLILIGVGLITSETRTVISAEYDPTIQNTVTLSVTATGSAGAVASGDSLSGGSTSAPASAHIAISGTGDATHPPYQNIVGVTKYPIGGMKRTRDGDDWGTCGASTSRTILLADDGEFEFTAAQGTFIAGLSYNPNPLSHTDLNYGLQPNAVSSDMIGIKEIGGVDGVVLPGGVIGSEFDVRALRWQSGDRFKVKKTGTEITYYHNDSLIYTSTIAVTGTLYGNFVGFHNGSFMSESTMSPFPAGAINEGDAITVTVNDISVRYVVSQTDSVESVAGMLAAFLTSTWKLRSFLRATWDPADPTNVFLFAKHGTLTLDSNLTNDHPALLPNPTDAPTASSAAAGSLLAGDYTFGYTYRSASGETFLSPLATVRLADNQKVNLTGPTFGSWPTGTSTLGWYMSRSPGDPNLGFLIANAGGSFVVNTLPNPGATAPPAENTAGEETIRVMASFTKENIRKGQFSWPLGDLDKGINQVLIKYREAKEDFAERQLFVNDYDHQKQILKTNKLQIDGQGIDNFNQAFRIANAALAKEREGNFFCEWQTDEAGIIFEEGDVVCCTDVSGGFINIPLRIEELTIAEDGDVQFKGRLYSTFMLSDDAGKHPIVIPTALRYVNDPPPVASNLVMTLDEFFLTGMVGDFDFSGFIPGQKAHIFLAGPSDTEPADYKMVDTVLPDPSNHGHFEIRALAGGKYWIRVVTESGFGVSARSGHPVVSVDIRPADVTGAFVGIDGLGEKLVQFIGHPRQCEIPAQYAVEIWNEDFTEYKTTFTVTNGTTHAVLLNATPHDGAGGGDVEGGEVLVIQHTDKNNLFSFFLTGGAPGLFSIVPMSGVSLEALNRTFQRFDFTLQWIGPDYYLGDYGTAVVALQTRSNANPISGEFTPNLSASPLSIHWSAGSGPGMVLETYKSFGTTLGSQEVDPGYGDNTGPLRAGRRYTFLLSGNEYRLYESYTAAGGQKPLAIISGASGIAFPLRFIAKLTIGDVDHEPWPDSTPPYQLGCMNIIAGGDLDPTTILSKRDQEELFPGVTVSPTEPVVGLKLYQKGSYGIDGHPVLIVAPAP